MAGVYHRPTFEISGLKEGRFEKQPIPGGATVLRQSEKRKSEISADSVRDISVSGKVMLTDVQEPDHDRQ